MIYLIFVTKLLIFAGEPLLKMKGVLYKFYCNLFFRKKVDSVINFSKGAGTDLISKNILARNQLVLEAIFDILIKRLTTSKCATIGTVVGVVTAFCFFSIQLR